MSDLKCSKCGYNHNTIEESCEQVTERVKVLMEALEINKSGYAGILPNGNIVDRRKHIEAIPIQENALFGIPKPKNIEYEEAGQLPDLPDNIKNKVIFVDSNDEVIKEGLSELANKLDIEAEKRRIEKKFFMNGRKLRKKNTHLTPKKKKRK